MKGHSIICALFVTLWISVAFVGAARLALTGTNEVGGLFETPVPQSYLHLQSLGMNIFRLPFEWEKMQPNIGQTFDVNVKNTYVALVNNITGSGAYALLDPHNYARYKGQLIGSSGGPSLAQFQSFWKQLATLFLGNNKVIFGLMNEPNSMATEDWLTDANAGIAGIRESGATQLIFVPGNAWTSAMGWTLSWYGTSNAVVMRGVQDPLNNFAFEIHTYFDSDLSGSQETCQGPNFASTQVMPGVTAWARQYGYKLFVGEFAGGNNPTCQQCIEDFLKYCEDNSDVYLGWTWWVAGPASWGNYRFLIEPANGQDAPQTAWLIPHLAGSNATPLPGSTNSASASFGASLTPSKSGAPAAVSASTAPSGSGAVYTNGLQGTWSAASSWSSSYSLSYSGQYTYPANSGSAISWNPSGYQGLYFTCTPSTTTTCFDDTWYSLSFWVNGGANGGNQNLIVVLRNGNAANTGQMVPVATVANSWVNVVITIARFGGQGPYSSFIIQDQGNPGNTIYIDEIYLVRNSGNQQPSPSGSPSRAGAPATSSRSAAQNSVTRSPAASRAPGASDSSTPRSSVSGSAPASRAPGTSASPSSEPSMTSQLSSDSQSSGNGGASSSDSDSGSDDFQTFTGAACRAESIMSSIL